MAKTYTRHAIPRPLFLLNLQIKFFFAIGNVSRYIRIHIKESLFLFDPNPSTFSLLWIPHRCIVRNVFGALTRLSLSSSYTYSSEVTRKQAQNMTSLLTKFVPFSRLLCIQVSIIASNLTVES